MHIEKTVTIACSPSEVWAFIADPTNDPRWCHKVDSVEQTSGDGPAVGAEYRVLHRPRPLKSAVELTVEVMELDEPHLLRLREKDEDGVFNVTYEIKAVGSQTQLTQIDDIEWTIPKLALPVARMMVGRDLTRQFASLKRLLEGDGGEASGAVGLRE